MIKHILKGHRDVVHTIAVSRDNSTVIVSGSNDCTIQVWCTSIYKHIFTLEASKPQCWFFCVDCYNHGLIAAAGNDKKIRVWRLDLDQNKQDASVLLHTLPGHSGVVWGVKFSPDGMKLVSCSGDRTLRIWCVQTGMLLQVLSSASQVLLNFIQCNTLFKYEA
jgi:WD40 repeat protein